MTVEKEINANRYTVDGYVDKKAIVVKFGTGSGHVIVPGTWVGREVFIVVTSKGAETLE